MQALIGGKAIVVIGGMLLGAIAGLFVGALVGGNLATNFEFLDLRGYEATGIVGLLLGMLLGGALTARWGRQAH
ncbi:MAG TPA: hypothetical protein VFU02_25240 [Polyangiaceae bacterium]|nr:hypothetical protein [Polyangiaceae bacterium]